MMRPFAFGPQHVVWQWTQVLLLTLGGLASAGFGVSVPTHAATPVGFWYAEGGAAVVEIMACENALCGRIVWLRSPFDEQGCDLRDQHNPKAALRDRTLLGLPILHGLQQADPHEPVWSGGTIYDPSSGRTYQCRVTLDSENRLRLRGYIGVSFFGRTTTWVRVGTENATCRTTASAIHPGETPNFTTPASMIPVSKACR